MVAKKKVVKKKVVRKRSPVKKSVARKIPVRPKRRVRATKRKINLVLRNLIIFVVLAVLSSLLYSVSNSLMYQEFFLFLSWILGFVALAFLISLLVLLIFKSMKR